MGARRLALRCPGCKGELGALDALYCQAPACRELEQKHYEAKAKELSEVERDRLSIEALNALRKRAMEDPVVFFELVLRDESTQRHVTVAPHQKVLLSFLVHPAHEHAVIILPVGCAKSVSAAGLGLWMLARNLRLRGSIWSATQGQAKKPIMAIRTLIEESADLQLIAPHLMPTRRTGEPWADDKLTVDRPLGIRDPSFVAFGIDSASAPGSRLELPIVDDLMNRENTSTPEAREKTYSQFFATVKNRVEPNSKWSRVWILNTTWHPDDYVNRVAAFWPTLRMSVRGDIHVSNADPAWDCEELVAISTDPRPGGKTHCRLAAHEPDPKNEKPLWPERYSAETIEKIRQTYIHSPGDFARFYESSAEDDSGALCKREFVVRCKRKAQEDGIHELVSSYLQGEWLTF